MGPGQELGPALAPPHGSMAHLRVEILDSTLEEEDVEGREDLAVVVAVVVVADDDAVGEDARRAEPGSGKKAVHVGVAVAGNVGADCYSGC